MTVRNILSIDIDDSKFKSFIAEYKKYQDMLAKAPKAWAATSAQAEKQSVSFSQMVAALLAQTELASKLTKQQHDTTREVDHQAAAWHRISASAKSFAGHIVSVTRSLLTWGAATTAISGILGIGGLWGFDRLAQAASSGRRSSLGLGVTYGEQKAFGVNFGRVVNSDQFLGGVNAALHDLTARPALYGAGLTEGDIHGKDTAQVAALVLQRLKPLVDKTPESQLGQLLAARHLGQLGLGVQDLERIRSLSPGELQDYQKHYGSDAVRMNLTDRQMIAWQRLQVQLTRAGDTIESSLIRSLTPLAPELAALSKGFTDVVQAFLGSKDVKRWIDLAAGGLESFAHYIGTPQFKADVELAAHGVSEFASAVVAAVNKIAGFLGLNSPTGSPSKPTPTRPGETPPAVSGWGYDWKTGRWTYQRGTDGAPIHQETYRTMGTLPSGLLHAVAMTESGGNASAVNPRTGAMGAFQFMPSTWAQYGGGASPFDPAAAAQAARRYLGHLLGEFGSVEKALAAYNWGPGNLERELKQFGAAWRQHLPAETQHYLARILPQIGAAPRQPAVTVQDRTGGSVVISGAQLAT